MIHLMYGRYYDIRQLFVNPSDQGHTAVARERTYLILFWRGVVRQLYDPVKLYDEVSAFIREHVATRPRDYLIGTKQQVLAEARHVAQVRKTRFRKEIRLNFFLRLDLLAQSAIESSSVVPRIEARGPNGYSLRHLLNQREMDGCRLVQQI